MTRDELIKLIIEKAAESVPNLDTTNIDTSLSLRDYGASSLDLVEIVSELMQELRIRIPREELNKISSIDSLADLLLRLGDAQSRG
jgi:acyl carrier protein